MYMPKVQTLILDFEDFQADVKKQMATIAKQLAEIKSGGGGIQQKQAPQGGSSLQEILRKVQEHDRTLKRIQEGLPDYATNARVDEIQNRLIYFATEEFTMQSCTAVKEYLMKELKKALEMIIQMECNIQVEYLSQDQFNRKWQDLQETLQGKLSINDFNEALEKYDQDVKDENKETYDYIKTVKKHFAMMTDELERIREAFTAYDVRLKDKANVSEVQ